MFAFKLKDKICDAVSYIPIPEVVRNKVANMVANIRARVDMLPDSLERSRNPKGIGLQNGLMHYYCGRFYEAILRLQILKFMGAYGDFEKICMARCYFQIGKDEKAKQCFVAVSNSNDRNVREIKDYYELKMEGCAPEMIPFCIISEIESYKVKYDTKLNRGTFNDDVVCKISKKLMESGFLKYSKLKILDIMCGIGTGGFGAKKGIGYSDALLTGVAASTDASTYCGALLVEENATGLKHKVYDQICESNPEDFLLDCEENMIAFDAIFCGSWLQYRGDVAFVFKLLVDAMEVGGILALSFVKTNAESTEFFTYGDVFAHPVNLLADAARSVGLDLLDVIESKNDYYYPFAGGESLIGKDEEEDERFPLATAVFTKA